MIQSDSSQSLAEVRRPMYTISRESRISRRHPAHVSLIHVLAHARLAARANPREGGCAVSHQSCACAKRLLDSALGILKYVCPTVLLMTLMYRAAKIAVRGKWQVSQCLIRLSLAVYPSYSCSCLECSCWCRWRPGELTATAVMHRYAGSIDQHTVGKILGLMWVRRGFAKFR